MHRSHRQTLNNFCLALETSDAAQDNIWSSGTAAQQSIPLFVSTFCKNQTGELPDGQASCLNAASRIPALASELSPPQWSRGDFRAAGPAVSATASWSRNATGVSTTTCFPALAQAMTCSGVHSARGQDRNRVDILPRQKIIDLVAGRDAELRGDGVGARANRIAHRNETGPLDMTTAQQLGMPLRDASTSEQAKSDHHSFLCGGRPSHREIRRPLAREHSIVQRSILTKAAVNQGGLCPLGDWAIPLRGEIPRQRLPDV